MTDQTVIRLTTPGELASAIPRWFGFVPENSIVVMSLQGKRVVFSARLDMQDIHQVYSVLPHMAQQGADTVFLAVYEDELCSHFYEVSFMGTTLQLAGLRINDVVSIAGGRCRSYLCDNDDCCPPEGKEIAREGWPDTALAATGMTMVSSREELAKTVAFGGEDLGPSRDIVDAARLGAALGVSADDALLAALANTLGTPLTRDVVTLALLALDEPKLSQAVDLLYATMRRLPDDDYRLPQVSAVASLGQYLLGGGAILTLALERGARATSLGGIVNHLLLEGVPPKTARGLLQQAAKSLKADEGVA